MPTVNEVLGGWLDKASKHPKSTMQAALTNLMFLLSLVTALGLMNGKVAGAIATVLVAYKQYIGGTQADADTTEAIPAGGGKPEMVPAHPTPDNPGDTPVSAK